MQQLNDRREITQKFKNYFSYQEGQELFQVVGLVSVQQHWMVWKELVGSSGVWMLQGQGKYQFSEWPVQVLVLSDLLGQMLCTLACYYFQAEKINLKRGHVSPNKSKLPVSVAFCYKSTHKKLMIFFQKTYFVRLKISQVVNC